MRNIGYNLLSSLHHFFKQYFLTNLSEFLIVQILLAEAKCILMSQICPLPDSVFTFGLKGFLLDTLLVLVLVLLALK